MRPDEYSSGVDEYDSGIEFAVLITGADEGGGVSAGVLWGVVLVGFGGGGASVGASESLSGLTNLSS